MDAKTGAVGIATQGHSDNHIKAKDNSHSRIIIPLLYAEMLQTQSLVPKAMRVQKLSTGWPPTVSFLNYFILLTYS